MSGLPNITILTPTYNRKNVFKLAILNYLNIDYPRDNIEWIILDDSNEPMNDIIPNEKNIRYIYFSKEDKEALYRKFCEKYKKNPPRKSKQKKINSYHTPFFKDDRIPLGLKLNLGVKSASNNLILHMFDDCLYPPKSVYNRVATVVEHDSRCLGCLAYATFDTKLMVSMVNRSEANGVSKINMATLGYTRDFWLKQKFNDQEVNEDIRAFVKNREFDVKVLPGEDMIVKLYHIENRPMNLTAENYPEPNGWHFNPIPDNLFLFITEFDDRLALNSKKEANIKEDVKEITN